MGWPQDHFDEYNGLGPIVAIYIYKIVRVKYIIKNAQLNIINATECPRINKLNSYQCKIFYMSSILNK